MIGAPPVFLEFGLREEDKKVKKLMTLLLCASLILSGVFGIMPVEKVKAASTLSKTEQKKYQSILKKHSYVKSSDPFGGDFFGYDNDMFALYDLDGNGRKELIIFIFGLSFDTSYTAVYSYDGKKFRRDITAGIIEKVGKNGYMRSAETVTGYQAHVIYYTSNGKIQEKLQGENEMYGSFKVVNGQFIEISEKEYQKLYRKYSKNAFKDLKLKEITNSNIKKELGLTAKAVHSKTK